MSAQGPAYKDEGDNVTFLLNLSRDLRHRVKFKAVEEDKTMTEIIIEAIEERVKGVKAP